MAAKAGDMASKVNLWAFAWPSDFAQERLLVS
jgi:hypothetical protein